MSLEEIEELDLAAQYVQLVDKLTSKSQKSTAPFSGVFELTPRCNLNCKMCYVHLTPDQMCKIGRERTADEWIDMGKQTAASGTLTLLLTGGEPFIRPDFRRIYEELSSIGFLITIFSNGTLIDEKTVDWLVKMPPMSLRITLYGASNETYATVCGVQNGFDKTIKAAKLLKDSGIRVHFSTTIIQDNLHDIPLLNQLAKDMDIAISHNPNVLSEVRGASWEAKTSRLSTSQFSELVKDDFAPIESLCGNDGSFKSKCRKVNCGYWITWDGKITICSFLAKPNTLPFDVGFETAWRELNRLVLTIQQPQKCDDCKYKTVCMNCPGMLYAESGSYDEVSDRSCDLAKSFYSRISKRKA